MIRYCFIVCTLCLAIFFTGAVKSRAEKIQGDPTAVHIFGKAVYCADMEKWLPLTMDMALGKNTWFATSRKSSLILSLNGKDTVTISNDSIGALYEPMPSSADPEKHLWNKIYLQQGSFWINTASMENENEPFEVITPTARIITKKAVFNVVKGNYPMQPEEYWVWSGSIILQKLEKEVTINAEERILIRPSQAPPRKATHFNPKNAPSWCLWNAKKDASLVRGDLKSLEAATPPAVSIVPAAPVSGQSGAQVKPAQGGTQNTVGPTDQGGSNINVQGIRERIRVPPPYNP